MRKGRRREKKEKERTMSWATVFLYAKLPMILVTAALIPKKADSFFGLSLVTEKNINKC